MAHPNKRDTEASHAAKLKAMTTHYGLASKDNVRPGVEKYKGEGPEEDVGYGADSDKPKLHGARVTRMTKPTNPYATYKRGGAVKHRASGGDTSDIEQANIDEKLDRRRGGHVKHRADGGGAESLDDPKADTSRYAVEEKGRALPMSQREADQSSQLLSQAQAGGNKRGGKVSHRAHGGRIRGEEGPFKTYPGAVKMGKKDPTWSSEPSPTPVDNRARGGRAGGKHGKGGTHVNIMVAPQHGQPGAAGMPPISALPTPPPMPPGPRPPMGGPPMGAGMPPGGMPMGGPPPGAMPPGAVPPGLMPPRKRGGRIMAKKHHHDDADADARQIKHMVKESALKPHGSMRAAGGHVSATMFGAGRAAGGRVGLTAGAASGEGRLIKEASQRRHPLKSQEV